ncbi:MAG: S-layer homology domain-containing protein, partial [Firmicutes bacterium]|nr:S-layer homology domain-containing protein [Bacillota bacterium]
YIEYTPNSDAKPIVANGTSIWGTRTLSSAEQTLIDSGTRTIGGINADYFSFQTGIPMGNVIIDGEIVSAVNEGQEAVAFKSDGSAFIDWLEIVTTLSNGETSVGVECINKWYQAGFGSIFMFTDDFGASTHTSSNCYFVVCTPVSGKLAIDDALFMTVDDVSVYNGNLAIPEGKIVLALETDGIDECVAFVSSLNPGDTLSVGNCVVNNSRSDWAEADQAISSTGGRILRGGENCAVSDYQAAPRTAVGVKEDGSSVFYTIDGRQSGYSYGAQIGTVAERLKELGCIDAINLDGGGSTTIGAVFPGSEEFLIMNSPSDGYQRSVANFLFIRDDRTRTDIPWVVNFGGENENHNYLSGASVNIGIESVYDTAYFNMDSYSLDFNIENGGSSTSTVDSNGYIEFSGEGHITVTITGGEVYETREYEVYENPSEIKIYNEDDWREIDSIYTEANEELQLNLSALAYVNGVELICSDRLYSWSTEGDIGTVNDEGIFTLADSANKTGKIIITAGNCTKEIPVTIADYPRFNPFSDTSGHWAESTISKMSESGIINGVETENGLYFYPDNYITRAEFASIVCKFMGIDADEYADEPLIFADSGDIQAWAQNYVKAMYDIGIINGRANDDGSVSFAPNEQITRAEAMTILGRCAGDSVTASECNFADAADIPDWAADGIGKLLTLGAVSGYEDNTILPNNSVKRAEAVVMISKLSEQ